MEACTSQVRDGALVSGGLLLKDRLVLWVSCRMLLHLCLHTFMGKF